MDVKIIRLNKNNYKDYLSQIHKLSEQIKEENNKSNQEGQFIVTKEETLLEYIKSDQNRILIALNSSQEVVAFSIITLNTAQNTSKDYTKYFHAGINFKNHLANNFSDIKEYNRYVTKEYLKKIIIFDQKARQIIEQSTSFSNASIIDFIKIQIHKNAFYENNFFRRKVDIEMSKVYENSNNTTAYAKIYYYGIKDVDRKLLEKLYKSSGYPVPLNTLILNYELFLKYQQPHFIEKPSFDLTPFYNVESKNALEINTYAVKKEYRGQGLAKILLYESLKQVLKSYFANSLNQEIYLLCTIHNNNVNSQNVAKSFQMKKYLYIERTRNQNRRIYIQKFNEQDLLDFLYEIELELLIDYNYYSENFGIDIIHMKEKIIEKIRNYVEKIKTETEEEIRQYYQSKIDTYNTLLNNQMFAELKR